jgi:hypothetical protein
MNAEDLEARLIRNEQVEELKDMITCAICFQIITEDRNPQECDNC